MNDEPQVMAGPAPTPEEQAERRAKLDSRVRRDLWKAVWGASQVMPYDEIREHVEATIGVLAADEP